jgi:hypothetical protein
MLDISSRDLSEWPRRTTGSAALTRVGFMVSLLGHSALLALAVSTASTQLPSASVIPVAIVTTEDAQALDAQLSLSDQSIAARSESLPSSPQAEDAQTLALAKLEEGLTGADAGLPSTQSLAPADPRNTPDVGQETEVDQGDSHAVVERYPADTAVAVRTVTFREDKPAELADVKVTRRTDWQANPVQDNTLVYSVPGSAVRLTLREASSGGFLVDHDQVSAPFGLSQSAWDGNATAKSQKIEWTLIDSKNFGLTAFGYQSEIGYGFRPFDQTKKEFATAGANTIKAGGDVRLGAFTLGVAHSSIIALEPIVPAFSEAKSNAEATVDEASVSLNLAQLVASQDGLVAKLIPTVWMTTSDRQSAGYSIVSTSVGGSWKWNYGHATLGYWNYYSDGNSTIDSAWSGYGFDANLGAYYKAVALDLSASYGQSEDLAPQWQSSGALYSSTVAVSYTPEKVPGVFASATIGNYDRTELAYGNASPNFYEVNMNGEYLSIAAGLDFTNWFWGSEPSSASQLRSVKLLYRYSDTLTVDDASGRAGGQDSLVALMVQRKF